MIAASKIGRTGRNLSDHKVPLCGLSNKETEAQGSGLAQVLSLKQKTNLADWRRKELFERTLSNRQKHWES